MTYRKHHESMEYGEHHEHGISKHTLKSLKHVAAKFTDYRA